MTHEEFKATLTFYEALALKELELAKTKDETLKVGKRWKKFFKGLNKALYTDGDFHKVELELNASYR